MTAPALRSVLLVPSAYLPNVGGIEEVTRRLAAGLRARGLDVAVVTNRWPDGTARSERIDGIRVERISFHLPAVRPGHLARFASRAPASALSLLRIVRETRPDVVHLLGAGPNAAYVAALRPALRARIVLGTHGELSGDAHDAFARSSTLHLALRSLCGSADAVTAPSAHTLAELRAAFPVRGIVEVIPNAVDVEELAGAAPRSDLGRFLLAAGRLVPQKGFDTLLAAFSLARDELADCRLVLAGEGPERARLEREVRRLGLDGEVVLLGEVPRPTLAGLFAGADAVVVPSRREAFGLVALEAMAAGVPLVATTAGGLPEVAADGETALLVPPDDPDALAAALVRVLADDDLRETLVRNGRREAARRSWTEVVSRYEALYRRVLA